MPQPEKNKKVISYLEYYVKKLNDYAIFDEDKKTAKTSEPENFIQENDEMTEILS